MMRMLAVSHRTGISIKELVSNADGSGLIWPEMRPRHTLGGRFGKVRKRRPSRTQYGHQWGWTSVRPFLFVAGFPDSGLIIHKLKAAPISLQFTYNQYQRETPNLALQGAPEDQDSWRPTPRRTS